MKNFNFYLCLSLVWIVVISSCSQKQSIDQTSDTTLVGIADSISQTITPTVVDSLSITSEETPDSLTKMSEAIGDLDGDGVAEKAVVFNTKVKTDFGTQRMLYIYKSEDGNWKPWHICTGPVLASEHGGMMGDPFESISIDLGSLVIKHMGGSREKWNYTHRYEYRDNDWYLVSTIISYGAPCASFTTYDYDLTAGEGTILINTETCDDQTDEVKTTTDELGFSVKPENPVKMDNFYPGNNAVKIPGRSDDFYY